MSELIQLIASKVWDRFPVPYGTVMAGVCVLLAMWWAFDVYRLRRRRLLQRYDNRGAKAVIAKQYLDGGYPLEDDLREILTDECNDQIFAHLHGYSLDRERRRLLLPITRAANPPISWSTVKEARSYIQVKGGQIVVEVSAVDRFNHYSKSIVSLILFMMPFSVPIIAITEHQRSGWVGVWLGTTVICLFFSGLFIWSTFAVATALRLEKWLRSQEPAPVPITTVPAVVAPSRSQLSVDRIGKN